MSESSYINDGNFRYGITEYDQPCIPQYNSTLHHKKPFIRDFPNNIIRDDKMPYLQYTKPSSCCNYCDNMRDNRIMIPELLNIESSINKILIITMYGMTKELDKTINMAIGKKYKIIHITEKGLVESTGILNVISTGIPDECTKYFGNFTSVTTSAYIGLDCSTDGVSDKRLIYIASIRYIEQVFSEDEDKYPNLTPTEKLNTILNKLDSSITIINEYLENNNTTSTNESSNTEEENQESENNSDKCNGCKNECCLCNRPEPPKPPLLDPYHRPGPYQGPLIVGQMHPYPPAMGYGPGRPGIMIGHPHKCHCIKEEKKIVSLNDVLSNMNTIKDILNSFINEYRESMPSNECGCCNYNLDDIQRVLSELIIGKNDDSNNTNSNIPTDIPNNNDDTPINDPNNGD